MAHIGGVLQHLVIRIANSKRMKVCTPSGSICTCAVTERACAPPTTSVRPDVLASAPPLALFQAWGALQDGHFQSQLLHACARTASLCATYFSGCLQAHLVAGAPCGWPMPSEARECTPVRRVDFRRTRGQGPRVQGFAFEAREDKRPKAESPMIQHVFQPGGLAAFGRSIGSR